MLPEPPGLIDTAARDRIERMRLRPELAFPAYAEPWHALPRADQEALLRAAVAVLCLTLPPETAALVRRGRCPKLVAAAMRRLFPTGPPAGRVFGLPPPAEPRADSDRATPRTNDDDAVWDII